MIELEDVLSRLFWPSLAMAGFYIWSVWRDKWLLGLLLSLAICIESIWALHLSTAAVILDLSVLVVGGFLSWVAIWRRRSQRQRLDLLEDIDYPEFFLSLALVTAVAIVSHHIRVLFFR